MRWLFINLQVGLDSTQVRVGFKGSHYIYKSALLGYGWRGERVYDVITVGSATIDVFAHTDSKVLTVKGKKGPETFIAYPLGTKILITDLNFMVGGGGTNVAVSFSRLGLKTAFLGSIGVDENSHKVLELLHREQVDFIGQQQGQTGYSIVLDANHRDRTILTAKGSNNLLDQQFALKHLPKTKWLYASSMIEKSFDALVALIHEAKSNGTKVAFNPSSYQAKLGYTKLRSVLDCCNVLICNLEEAQLLFEKQGQPHHLKKFLKANPDTYVVITNGREGATCYYKGKTYHQQPSRAIPVVETTGAGDAFGSGFVAGLMHGLDPQQSLRLGMIQAEAVISAVGAKNNLLTKDVALSRLPIYEEIETIHAAKKHKYRAPAKKEFVLKNGVLIHDLEELAYYLKFVDEDTFKYHVTKTHNHFSTWIDHTFHLHKLATAVKASHTKDAISKKILAFVNA